MGSEVDGDESEFDDLHRFFATRYIRIFCDFCADCLWDIDGMEQEIITFPVTPGLRVRMIRWRERYHDLDRKYEKYEYGDIPEIPDDVLIEQKKDWDEFAAEGLAIARAVKEQLPDWTVVFLDETKILSDECRDKDRSCFEYEIGPDGLKVEPPPRVKPTLPKIRTVLTKVHDLKYTLSFVVEPEDGSSPGGETEP